MQIELPSPEFKPKQTGFELRLIFLYNFLVGVPIIGILGILRLGENLTPPISIKGTWNVEISPQTMMPQPCDSPLIHSEAPVLTISQSGPHLLLTFNDQESTTLMGEIHGTTLAADNASDDNPATTDIEATVDLQTEPGRLQGVLESPRCSLPTTITFTATRQTDEG